MRKEIRLGELAEDDDKRDAIHIAVLPVDAAETLRPGQHIGVDKDGKATAAEPHWGIVDPFLRSQVNEDERFFMCVYPNTVTSLRHEWTHPFLDKPSEASSSEQWLREYARKLNHYDLPEQAFARLLKGLLEGELFAHGSDLHGLWELDDADELKEHAQKYLGITIDWGKFAFSCSC